MSIEPQTKLKPDPNGVHFAHCYQGENKGICKYGDDDCPAKPTSIWLSDDPEAAAKYPHYDETMRRIEAVLDLAQMQGVTGPEIASMMASLHARAVARLHPNEQQRERVIGVFREALITCQTDLEDDSR